jgi:hypothetical protein
VLSEAEVPNAMSVMGSQADQIFREPPEGFRCAVDDLRPCREHKRPINRCQACWPGYLRYLGDLCIHYYAASKNFQVNVLRGANGPVMLGTANASPMLEPSHAGGQQK